MGCPSQLDHGVPDSNSIAIAKIKPVVVIATETELKHINDGLNSFLL
jgi:hypothetical protein